MPDYIGHFIRALIWEYRKQKRKQRAVSAVQSPSGFPDVAERLNPDPQTPGEHLAILRAGRRGDAEALEIMGADNPEARDEWGMLMRQHIKRDPDPPDRTLRESWAIVRAARRGNEAAWAIVDAEDDGRWFE